MGNGRIILGIIAFVLAVYAFINSTRTLGEPSSCAIARFAVLILKQSQMIEKKAIVINRLVFLWLKHRFVFSLRRSPFRTILIPEIVRQKLVLWPICMVELTSVHRHRARKILRLGQFGRVHFTIFVDGEVCKLWLAHWTFAEQ